MCNIASAERAAIILSNSFGIMVRCDGHQEPSSLHSYARLTDVVMSVTFADS